jgi:hypothetical protein
MAPRFLVFAEILLWLQVPAWRSRRAARAGAACVVVALGLQAASQWQLWRDFNDAAAPELALVRQLPGRARLQVALRTDQRFHGFWPAFLDHVPLYHLANGGLLVTNLFKLPHLPVVQRCARGDTAGQSAPCAPDYLLTSRIPASAHGPAARLVAERGPYALYSLSLGP